MTQCYAFLSQHSARNLFVFLLLLCSLTATAQTIRYVSTTGTNTNPATATSWATSTTNLQGAIAASSATDQVWVKAGTYKPTTTTGPASRTISFAMKAGVAIYGGFAGTETTLNQRPVQNLTTGTSQPSATTLSGDIGTLGNNTDNSYHVISNPTGLTTTAILDGFVITGGNANGTSSSLDQSGGGIFNNGRGSGNFCSPTIRNCLFQGNNANLGGAMFNHGTSYGSSSPSLINCSFQANSAGGVFSGSGGAIYNNGASGTSSPNLTNCAFQANTATASGSGGAIYNEGEYGTSSPRLINCSFQANAASQGGAMYNNSGSSGISSPSLTNCVLFDNGGGNTFNNNGGNVSARYSLFDASVIYFISVTGNLTTTISPFATTTSTQLAPCSYAINAGDPATTTATGAPAAVGSTDLAGNPRFFANAGTPTGRIDMGAVEYQGVSNFVSRLYVRAGATGANTGLSWTDAFTDLQSALNYGCIGSLTAGAPTPEIWVANGTYKPTTTTGPASRTISFVMRPNVAIYGGFVGTETTLSQRPPVNPTSGPGGASQPSATTLSGDIGTVGTNTDNSYHVISNPTGLTTTTAILDGFVITGGNANGTSLDQSGGGIYNNGLGNLAIRNCVFQANSATKGGAVVNYRGQDGTSNTSLINCMFQDNAASQGGAMYNSYTSPILTNCVFQANTASGDGGAMFNDSFYNGPSSPSSPVLTNCAFQANTARGNGGAMYNTGTFGLSSPILTNCSFQANAATGSGGAMYNQANDTGISSPILTNCSFQANTASVSGGAMFSDGTSGTSSPRLTNCVLFGNGGSKTIGNTNANVSARYSLFEPSSVTVTGFTSVTGNLTTGTLAATSSPFASSTATQLAPGSPAINAGDPATTTASVGSTDLAGNPRLVEGRIDIGAYEFQAVPGLTLVTSATPNPVCAGSTVVLSVTATAGTAGMPDQPYSYTWAAPMGITLSGTSSSAVSASIGASVSGSQTLTVTVGASGGSPRSTSLVSLTVIAPPTALFTPGSATLTCTSTSVTLTAGGTGSSYTFSAGAAQIGSTNQAVVSVPGTYTVTVRNTGGCTATATAIVVSNTAVPSLSILPTSATLTCASPTLSLTASGNGNARWDNNSINAVRSVSTDGVYSVTVTEANGCTATESITINQNITPPPATLASSGTLTCTNTSVTLTANTGTGLSYAFSAGAAQIGSTNQAVVSAPGTYTVTVSNTSGCTATATAIVVAVFPFPTRLYVNASATGANTGLTWADAFTDLQAALTYPSTECLSEIWVANGLYKPTSTTGPDSRTISFAMRPNVAIYGGFVGTETTLSQRPPVNPVGGPGGASQPSSTTLSGDIGLLGDNTDNSYHVISNPAGLTTSAILDGFVITGGNPNGAAAPDFYGGGIYNNGRGTGNFCNPTIRNCLFQANVAGAGGPMYAEGYGGAMYNNGGGAGNSSPSLTNCAFQSNVAGVGGAIFNYGEGGLSSPSLTNCLFQANAAAIGGAMLNRGIAGISSPSLTNCVFQGNTASGNGGAMYSDGRSSGNSSPSLTNCSFQANVASQGGAMYNWGSDRGTSSPSLTNCVLFGNGGGKTLFNADSASVSARYSLFDASVTGYLTGPGNLTTGTPAATSSPFSSSTSTQLAPGSPAINAGDPATTTAIVGSTDLAGNPRFVSGRIDMGAYEFESPTGARAATGENPTSSKEEQRSLLYPNPVSAGGSVVLEPAVTYRQYRVVDILGRVVLRADAPGELSGLNTAGLAGGVYTLQVETPSGWVRWRMVVQ
ncbi:T9SS type A sorting domain-containing protein [Spirosoma spitsbergense]|uniref:T9SS type A sorting domain-containing protein n=1 Tax=Spirosoma spitsbergense TaxID=431554 RepID=UPI00037575EE|nr:T9SS type A sorting domain-containing protein [Spirosoma spitsbergense]